MASLSGRLPGGGEGADIQCDVNEWTERAADGEYVDFEADLKQLDGEEYTLSGYFRPVTDDEGNVVSIIVSDRDITERKQIERRLREREERFRQIAEHIEEVFWMTPPDKHDMTYVSPAYEEVWGRSRQSLYEDPTAFLEAIHPEDRDRVQAAIDEQVSGEYDEEYRVVQPDGEIRWVHDRAFPIENERGEVYRIVGIAEDVTQRKQMDQELRESEAKFRMVAENLDEIVWMMTPDTGQFLYVNPTYEDVFGQDRKRLYEDASAYKKYLHPEDRTAVLDTWNKLPDEAFEAEYRIIRPDDEQRWIHEQATGVYDEAGHVTRIVGIANDITDRKEREEELERRARQQQVVADLGQFALETDNLDELMHEAASQVATVLDNEYCKVLDLDPNAEELLLRQGVGWQEGIVGEATVSSVEADSQAAYTLAHKDPIIVENLETETRFSGPDLLTSHDVRSGISTIIGSIDEPWGILGTHDTARTEFTDEDVRFVQSVANILAEAIERHRYQEELERLVDHLEESNKRLEQFAYAASHDLQEPLRMISSYLQLIESRYGDKFDEEGEEFLAFAVDGADRMREMIEGLLAYSRVETQGDPFAPVDLNAVLEDVRDNLQLQIEDSDADLTVDALPVVEGDASQLQQVFQNLIDNAIEYSGEEPPEVEVSADQRNKRVVVSVSDKGIGIEPDDQERVFEVFERLHTHDEYEGTGIGLALCERIVERHNGEIWVESGPGEGTTVFFTLPAAEVSPSGP